MYKNMWEISCIYLFSYLILLQIETNGSIVAQNAVAFVFGVINSRDCGWVHLFLYQQFSLKTKAVCVHAYMCKLARGQATVHLLRLSLGKQVALNPLSAFGMCEQAWGFESWGSIVSLFFSPSWSLVNWHIRQHWDLRKSYIIIFLKSGNFSLKSTVFDTLK